MRPFYLSIFFFISFTVYIKLAITDTLNSKQDKEKSLEFNSSSDHQTQSRHESIGQINFEHPDIEPPHLFPGENLTNQLKPFLAEKAQLAAEIIHFIFPDKNKEDLPIILRDLMKTVQQPGERWRHQNITLHHENQIKDRLEQLQFIQPIKPKDLDKVDAILLLSGSRSGLSMRLNYYIEQIEPFINAEIPLYVLSGPRILEEFEKTNLPEMINSETTMAQHLIEKNKSKMNPNRKVVIDPGFVEAGFYRGTTSSNVKSWLRLKLPYSNLLIISSQPEIQTQAIIFRYYLNLSNTTYQFEVVGPTDRASIPLHRSLNAFSKWLNWQYSLYYHPDFQSPKAIVQTEQ